MMSIMPVALSLGFTPPPTIMQTASALSGHSVVGDDALVNGLAVAAFAGICAVQSIVPVIATAPINFNRRTGLSSTYAHLHTDCPILFATER